MNHQAYNKASNGELLFRRLNYGEKDCHNLNNYKAAAFWRRYVSSVSGEKIKLFKYISILILVSSPVFGAVKVSNTAKITSVESYSEYGGGDVIFKISPVETVCKDGYWLKKGDPGFEANLSLLLASFHSKANVVIRGHDDQIWGGSSGVYCHLYSIKNVE